MNSESQMNLPREEIQIYMNIGIWKLEILVLIFSSQHSRSSEDLVFSFPQFLYLRASAWTRYATGSLQGAPEGRGLVWLSLAALGAADWGTAFLGSVFGLIISHYGMDFLSGGSE